jgi:ATP-dependent RNA helicase DDX6/DHH1
MDQRARYPPGIGNGRGGNPNYYGRGPPQQLQQEQHHHQQPPPPSQAYHQQYVQRQSQPQPQPSQHLSQQQQQQQQWLRRQQIAGEAAGAGPQKATPAVDGIDSR